MISAIKKPRNARSKRALEKRQPQVHEPVKTALFVTAAQSSALVQKALTQLAALKKPHAIAFSKKKSNDVNPFVDSSSIDFWSVKNDASLMIVGDSKKKRKDNLTWIRCYDGRVLDMIEMGIEKMQGTEEFKPPSLPDIGARPVFHFAGPQFSPDAVSTYPAHAQLRSTLLDFYRGEETLNNGIPIGGQVALQGGLQYVISVTALSTTSKSDGATSNPTLADLYAAGAATSSTGYQGSTTAVDSSAAGSKILFRTYTVTVPPKTPVRAIQSNFELHECGPSFDFVLRRRQPADATMLAQSLKRAKTQAEKNRQGKSDTYKKNIETDEMGDMIGRVHVGKQDLSQLQTRKMKGLKADARGADDEDEEEEGVSDSQDSDGEDEFMGLESGDEDESVDAEEDLAFGSDSDEDGGEDEPSQVAANGRKRGRK
ncbi:unnamed protein product [Parajaminaea phylloscopi]